MRALFTLTIFIGSALLFMVQPMVAKMILPTFGGAPSVWNASMVFFQAALLLGYAYAHFSVRAVGARRQPILHLAVMLLALAVLPIALPTSFVPRSGFEPALQVVGLLGWIVGLPFFIVSAGAPLLQRWFAATDDPRARDPYFLYSASNAGSMLALLSYPFLIEPRLRLSEQSYFWAAAYVGLVAMTAVSGVAMFRRPAAAVEQVRETDTVKPSALQRLRWVLLAAVPSSLLLGATMFLTTNVAPVPLLWVVPLALYLLTFILAFAAKPLAKGKTLARFLPLLVLPLALVIIFESHDPIEPIAIFHLVVFLLAAWTLHTLLSESRPAAGRLTEFYLWIALGGVLGGAFNAFAAPVLFDTVFEYPIALSAALVLLPRQKADAPRFLRMDLIYPLFVLGLTLFTSTAMSAVGLDRESWSNVVILGVPLVVAFLAVDRPLRLGLSVLAVFAGSYLTRHVIQSNTVFIDRSFFGVTRVAKFDAPGGYSHLLIHGNTQHGEQIFNEELEHMPLAYYHPTGPIGQVFHEFSGIKAKENVALVGLGVGSLAAYGNHGQNMTFYEIDPMVERIARDPKLFTFLRDSLAEVRVVIGDARLSLVGAPEGHYGLIVLDAFTSDAIPLHLLTKEAMELYLRKLTPDGLIAVHISNRYLELEPVVTATASTVGLVALHQHDIDVTPEQEEIGKSLSEWMVLARREADFGHLPENPSWQFMSPSPEVKPWTDDYSNILTAYLAKRAYMR